MSEDRKGPGIAIWAIVMSVVALLTYGEAYFLMADYPDGVTISGDVLAPDPLLRPKYVAGNLELDQNFWTTVFRPAHSADQRVRPEKWKFKNWR